MHPNALRGRTLIAFMLSASLASTIGGLPFNLLPVLLGTLNAPLWMNRLNWRLLTLVSTAGTALGHRLCCAQAAGRRGRLQRGGLG
ncbi:hypothetical protein [Simplicispira psychrophila]|uniref:hypothetical protein n=1 Tax=Simplicispira psychrophila TaxID=80882 RepID=UPI0004887C00|nr:hypothetical protein [Simplicispira psychrophila]